MTTRVGRASRGPREPWWRCPLWGRPLGVPQGEAVPERGQPGGHPWVSAGDTCRDAATQARRAARAVEGGDVSVPQARDGSSRARRMPAHRV